MSGQKSRQLSNWATGVVYSSWVQQSVAANNFFEKRVDFQDLRHVWVKFTNDEVQEDFCNLILWRFDCGASKKTFESGTKKNPWKEEKRIHVHLLNNGWSASSPPDRFLAASGLVFSSPCEKREQTLFAKIRYIRSTMKIIDNCLFKIH